ncbi:MAG TPA: protein kinase [Vicinamibacterales bacterium]|nr:protein kinase [Vicinamibacterales bacterium]
MTLSPGTRLGPYEVVAKLGEGGMGEVFRARDTRLDRMVAIKVLPAGVAADPDRRVRFEREARAIAALSHPNILAIHDVGQSDALLYAVTELLDGTTLRERLTAPLPARKAVDIGIQIARGLAAAHERGIVHRDLKPENIFLLDDGRVKILDFGLAKTVESADAIGAAATAMAPAMTDPGMVLGTVGYMAPEQVRGQATDARTDLFALGAVLYEMLTGQRAFRRDTAAETMTAILREDPPDLVATRADLSPAFERIVRHCLEKSPAERFQTARDVAFALDALSGTSTGTAAAPVVEAPRRRFGLAAALVALPILGIAGGFALATSLRPAAEPAEIAFTSRTWDPQWITNARYAPDGKTVFYSAALSGNEPSLFIARPGAVVAQPLGEPGTHLLSVSRTGELAVLTHAAFINHRMFRGTLTRMTVDGAGRPLLEGVREADWAPDGSTMAIVRDDGTKDRLEYPIDKVLHEAAGYISDPRVSPDGTRVAFLEHPIRYDDRGWLKVVDASGTVKTLAGEFAASQSVTWSADGRHVFVSVSTGGAEYLPIVVNADGDPEVRQAFPSMSSSLMMDVAGDGRLLGTVNDIRLTIRAQVAGLTPEREFPWQQQSLANDLSADGQWLVFTDQSESAGVNYGVAIRKTDGSPAARLGEGAALGGFSPDGKQILAFVPSPAPGRHVIYPTGPGQPRTIDFTPIANASSVSWFLDGRVLFCSGSASESRCYVRAADGGTPSPVTPPGIGIAKPSPDGRTILSPSSDGAWHVVDVATQVAHRLPGSFLAHRFAGWSRDGRSVFVSERQNVPTLIERVDLATGARTRVRELAPPDRAGVIAIIVALVRDDGQSYVYTTWRNQTTLVEVTGVKAAR